MPGANKDTIEPVSCEQQVVVFAMCQESSASPDWTRKFTYKLIGSFSISLWWVLVEAFALPFNSPYIQCLLLLKMHLSYCHNGRFNLFICHRLCHCFRNRVLTITNATLSAEGNYVCECQGGSGETSRKVITLTMECKKCLPVSNVYFTK